MSPINTLYHSKRFYLQYNKCIEIILNHSLQKLWHLSTYQLFWDFKSINYFHLHWLKWLHLCFRKICRIHILISSFNLVYKSEIIFQLKLLCFRRFIILIIHKILYIHTSNDFIIIPVKFNNHYLNHPFRWTTKSSYFTWNAYNCIWTRWNYRVMYLKGNFECINKTISNPIYQFNRL